MRTTIYTAFYQLTGLIVPAERTKVFQTLAEITLYLQEMKLQGRAPVLLRVELKTTEDVRRDIIADWEPPLLEFLK